MKKSTELKSLEEDLFIGIDIGKTKIAAGIVTGSGQIITKQNVPTDMENGGLAIVDQCVLLIKLLVKKTNISIKGIGVGSSGLIDYKKGIILSSGSIPNWENINLKDILENKFEIPVSVENDVNVAALGEYLFGAGKGTKTSVFVIIGTGVGFCTIDRGTIWHGSHSLAGQIAHLPLFGSEKTVNGVFSGKGISDNASSVLGRSVSTEEAFELFENKYSGFDKIINEVIKGAAITLTWIQNSIDPDIIILGGGVAVGQKNFIDLVYAEVEQNLKKYKTQLKDNIKIVPAILENNAGIVGAAALRMKLD